MTTQPGEVKHEKGRERARLFAGCLQQIVNGFRADYFVENHPDKLMVPLSSGREFSFDIRGQLNYGGVNCDVWIEAKGYDKGSGLLDHYRSFIRHVALTRLEFAGMRDDTFWFVSSSPFACDDGSDVSTWQWMRALLLKQKGASITDEEFSAIENAGFEALARSIRILFLTAELMRTTGLKQTPEAGDSIWTLTRRLYGGIVPVSDYKPYTDRVSANTSGLTNPDLIYPGQNIWLPFLGWPEDSAS